MDSVTVNTPLDEEISSPINSPTSENNENLIPIDLNQNIFNAFLLAAYKPDCCGKWKSVVHRDIKKTLQMTSYATAVIQIISVFILIFINIASMLEDDIQIFFDEWTLFPSKWQLLVLWPFFTIGMTLLFKNVRDVRFDIWVLEEYGITNDNFNLRFLKYFSELYLFYLGGFAYFVSLALSTVTVASDALEIVLNILAFTYIFELDEWVYELFRKDMILQNIWDMDNFFIGYVSARKRFTSRKASLERFKISTGIWIGICSTFLTAIIARCYVLLGIDVVFGVCYLAFNREVLSVGCCSDNY